jgi:actin-related protein
VFPASGTGGTSSLPALAKYLDERATQIANDKTVVRVAFSPNCMASADDTHVWRTN